MARPDSRSGGSIRELYGWGKLEKDAAKDPCEYFGINIRNGCHGCPVVNEPHTCCAAMALDLISRAEALAGVVE